MPGTPPDERLRPASEIPSEAAAIERGGWFSGAVARRYEREIAYTTAEYLDLLATYSGHRALEASAREALFACIAGLIDERRTGLSPRACYGACPLPQVPVWAAP